MRYKGAPRDAVLNPWHSQEELGGLFLGHRVYLKAKARGEKSMLEKRGLLEDAKGTAPRGPPDRANATLPEPQSPAGECRTLAATASPTRRYRKQTVRLSRSATSVRQGDDQRGH